MYTRTSARPPLSRVARLILATLLIAHASPLAIGQAPQRTELPPAVTIRSPANGYTFRLPSDTARVTIPLVLEAKGDARWKVTRVEFEIRSGGVLVGTFPGTGTPSGFYSYYWNVDRPCQYTVSATAYYDDAKTAAADNIPVNNAAGFTVAAAPPPRVFVDNGIAVGQTKLFDERTLAIMLQSLEATMANRNFFDQTSLASALGKFQGGRQETSALGVSVTGLPVPGVSTTTNTGENTTTTQTATQGVLLGPSPPPQGTSTTTNVVTPNNTTTVVTQPSVSPQAPALPAQTSALSYQPPYNVGAQDLLAEQMSLTYQVINLRMLLQGSISDRVLSNTGTYADGETRARAIAGFQISIDPLKRYQDALAEVEVTISSQCPQEQPPSLVSLMPQDKTYNVATISRDARQFGFGAVVQVLNVGVNYGRTKEALYLVRDTDTVAFQRVQERKSVTFGWQFRPVLGRRTVEPGTRQVYAVLSLPVVNGAPYSGDVQVRTRWLRYDAKTGAVGDEIAESINHQSLDSLAVTSNLSQPMQPAVESVSWEDIGGGKALVVVGGQNFLPGTTIMIGGTTLDSGSSGLIVPDEKNLRFVTAGKGLAQVNDAMLFGRFGPPTEIRDPMAGPRFLAASEANDTWGISIVGDPAVETVDAQNSKVTVTLKSRNGHRPVQILRKEQRRPLVLIGDSVFGMSDAPVTVNTELYTTANPPKLKDEIEISFIAPTQLLRDARKLRVKYPFLGDDFVADAPVKVENTFTASKVSLLASDDTTTQIAVSGTKFDKSKIQIWVGSQKFDQSSTAFNFLGDKLVQLNLPLNLKQLKQVGQIIVRQDDSNGVFTNVVLPLTVSAGPSPKPQVMSQDTISVGDAKVIKLKGANFGSIKNILFEGQSLHFDLDDDGATLNLTVPSVVTALAGTKKLDLVLKDDNVIPYNLTVGPR